MPVSRGWKGAGAEADVGRFAGAKLAGFLADNWPFGEPCPALYYDPRTASPGTFATLHAKCVVVDERLALVTSANFTGRGHARNIEVGVLIEDERFATELSRQWHGLVAAGLVRRASEAP